MYLKYKFNINLYFDIISLGYFVIISNIDYYNILIIQHNDINIQKYSK